MKALAIAASPRKNGNSDRLLQQAVEGACRAGFDTELVYLRTLNPLPCSGCEQCNHTGVCVIQDDIQPLLKKLTTCDRLFFATPVYFCTVSAQAKLLIDRTQWAWARRFRLNKPLSEHGAVGRRAAAVFAVGSQAQRPVFRAIARTMQSCLPNLGLHYARSIFVTGIDAMGEIDACSDALEAATELGLAASTTAAFPPPRDRFFSR